MSFKKGKSLSGYSSKASYLSYFIFASRIEPVTFDVVRVLGCSGWDFGTELEFTSTDLVNDFP